MPEFKGEVPPQERGDKRIKPHEYIVKAETIIFNHCGERTLGQKVDFSSKELTAVARVWDELEPKIKNLTLAAFPEIAVHILTVEILEKRAEEESETEK